MSTIVHLRVHQTDTVPNFLQNLSALATEGYLHVLRFFTGQESETKKNDLEIRDEYNGNKSWHDDNEASDLENGSMTR